MVVGDQYQGGVTFRPSQLVGVYVSDLPPALEAEGVMSQPRDVHLTHLIASIIPGRSRSEWFEHQEPNLGQAHACTV